MAAARCQCGGVAAYHQNDAACWCPQCMSLPDAQRCTTFTPQGEEAPRPAAATDEPVKRLIPAKRPKPPKADAPQRLVPPAADPDPDGDGLPALGTLGRQVLEHVTDRGPRGATDDQVADALDQDRQAVAACRDGLVRRGLLRDSGLRVGSGTAQAVAWAATTPRQDGQTWVESALGIFPAFTPQVEDDRVVLRDQGGLVFEVLRQGEARASVTTSGGQEVVVVLPGSPRLWERAAAGGQQAEEVAEEMCQQIHAASRHLRSVGH